MNAPLSAAALEEVAKTRLVYCECCDEEHPTEDVHECDCGRIVCDLHSCRFDNAQPVWGE